MVKPWLAYSLIRVGVFAVLFVALLFTALPPWLSAIVAAVIGLCVAYLFFGRLRHAVATDLAERRATASRHQDADAQAEDAAL